MRHPGRPCDIAKRQRLGTAFVKNPIGRVEQAGPQIAVVISAGRLA